jgi:hypothetical protein
VGTATAAVEGIPCACSPPVFGLATSAPLYRIAHSMSFRWVKAWRNQYGGNAGNAFDTARKP